VNTALAFRRVDSDGVLLENMEPGLIQRRMFEDARNYVRNSGQFKSAQDLAELFRLDLVDLRSRLEARKNRGEIFSIDDGDSGELFPVFGFDQTRDLRPYEAMSQLLEILANIGSKRSIASWFIGLNSYLDDQCPKDLLCENPEWVIEAARDQGRECAHG
jgi:hypothetical protein